jgi:DNA-binding ferritin-like protein (Dps family)
MDVALKCIDQKWRYRRYKKRIEHLPTSYRTAVAGMERYTYHLGGIGEAESLLSMLDDLTDLFEQAAANGTPVREIVGADPVEFAEAFLSNYRVGSWITRERERLTRAVEQAEAEDTGTQGVR